MYLSKDQLCPSGTCAMCIQLKGSKFCSLRSIALTKLSSFNYYSNFFHQDQNPLSIRSRLSQIHLNALAYYEVKFNKSWKQRQTHLKRKLLICQTIWKLEEIHSLCAFTKHILRLLFYVYRYTFCPTPKTSTLKHKRKEVWGIKTT